MKTTPQQRRNWMRRFDGEAKAYPQLVEHGIPLWSVTWITRRPRARELFDGVEAPTRIRAVEKAMRKEGSLS